MKIRTKSRIVYIIILIQRHIILFQHHTKVDSLKRTPETDFRTFVICGSVSAHTIIPLDFFLI